MSILTLNVRSNQTQAEDNVQFQYNTSSNAQEICISKHSDPTNIITISVYDVSDLIEFLKVVNKNITNNSSNLSEY